jgi:hypothetical protein|eukprot:4429620-Prymnesium_polylepis.1
MRQVSRRLNRAAVQRGAEAMGGRKRGAVVAQVPSQRGMEEQKRALRSAARRGIRSVSPGDRRGERK